MCDCGEGGMDMDRPLSIWGYGPAPFRLGIWAGPLLVGDVIMPFIGRKNGTLTARQQSYNDVDGWYSARIEHLFGQFWHWGLASRPPRKRRERERQMCVPCAVRGTPPSQLVVSARSIIVMNVLMPTLVGNKLFIRQYMRNTQ